MSKIIKIDDVEGKVYELDDWKPTQANQVKKYFIQKYHEIEQRYKELSEDFKWNKILYESEILFVPVIGKVYHLYQNKDEKRFLSLIAPDDWSKNKDVNYIASFKQDSRQKWNKVEYDI
jgi:hypothetical protein|tara:strand:- start:896 stop:1252 length:357 start_codon:yes stop_codon:yes gene_type:complete